MNSIETLKNYDYAYYNTGTILISDKEYDILKAKAKTEFPNDPYFQTVGVTPAGSIVKLPYILGSLNKMKPNGSLLEWCRSRGLKTVIVSDKLDGVSVYASYINGKLSQAATRGNGYEGRDITDKVRRIQPTVGVKGFQELRGEALMTPENCAKLGYSLPRSAVAGIFNADNDDEHLDKCQYIDIAFYTILYSDTSRDFMDMSVGAPLFAEFEVNDDLENTLTEYLKNRKSTCPYDIDGLVICDPNDLSVGEDYYPSNMCAFKVNEEAVETIVTDIEWEIKRSGKLQPVVVFEETVIGGSVITRATGFNKKFIIDNDIKIGSRIGIVRSGDIIPYITENYSRFSTHGQVELLTHCPSCGMELEETNTGVDLVCSNTDGCFAQMIYRIENFLLAHEVEEITATTIRKLGITDIEGLYDLDEFDISQIDGMGTKKADIILRELEKTLNTTEEKLLKSFGIPGIGDTASKMIVNKFNNFDSLFTISADAFMEIDGIGEIMARNLVRGLQKNQHLYHFLSSRGLKFKTKASANLQGMIFTLTGKSDISRNDLTKMVSSHGGMVKGISKNTNYLVTDSVNDMTSKTKKALQYGIPVITYQTLLNMIEE
jgi:DNA ligase (NAD+)